MGRCGLSRALVAVQIRVCDAGQTSKPSTAHRDQDAQTDDHQCEPDDVGRGGIVEKSPHHHRPKESYDEVDRADRQAPSSIAPNSRIHPVAIRAILVLRHGRSVEPKVSGYRVDCPRSTVGRSATRSAARVCGPRTGSPSGALFDLRDYRRLRVRVGVHVGPVAANQFPFGALIEHAVCAVSAEVVPEQ